MEITRHNPAEQELKDAFQRTFADFPSIGMSFQMGKGRSLEGCLHLHTKVTDDKEKSISIEFTEEESRKIYKKMGELYKEHEKRIYDLEKTKSEEGAEESDS